MKLGIVSSCKERDLIVERLTDRKQKVTYIDIIEENQNEIDKTTKFSDIIFIDNFDTNLSFFLDQLNRVVKSSHRLDRRHRPVICITGALPTNFINQHKDIFNLPENRIVYMPLALNGKDILTILHQTDALFILHSTYTDGGDTIKRCFSTFIKTTIVSIEDIDEIQLMWECRLIYRNFLKEQNDRLRLKLLETGKHFGDFTQLVAPFQSTVEGEVVDSKTFGIEYTLTDFIGQDDHYKLSWNNQNLLRIVELAEKQELPIIVIAEKYILSKNLVLFVEAVTARGIEVQIFDISDEAATDVVFEKSVYVIFEKIDGIDSFPFPEGSVVLNVSS